MRITFVLGYMLKILKNKLIVSDVKQEFNAIKHGDYDTFIKLVNAESVPLVVYQDGVGIRTGNLTHKNTCDFGGILLSSNALEKFYKTCEGKYGNFLDSDISDELFEKLAEFEVSLRLHANNNKLLKEKETLINVINKLSSHLKLLKDEIDALHECRKLLNNVKHNQEKIDYTKFKFIISSAFEVLKYHGLTIL